MALRSSFTVAKSLGSLRTLRVCLRVCTGEGAGGHNHHLCPIWPFRVSDFDRGREPQIQPGLRARHVRAGDMLGVSDSSGEKDLTSAELGDKWGRQGTPVSRNSSGKAVATRGLSVHLGSSRGWSTGCWGEGGRQSV